MQESATYRGRVRSRAGAAAAAAIVVSAALGAGALAQEGEGRPDVRPPARIAVSPGKFEVPIDGDPVVESMKLINLGDKAVDIRVTVVPWELDADGQVTLVEPTEQSLDQWMLVNPRTFTVGAASEQTIRFSIRPRTRPEAGEHRAMIYFEEVPAAPRAGRAVQVRFKLGVAVYAYAGEVRRVGELHGVRVAADPGLLSAAFDVSAAGNVHVRMRGQYAIWPEDGFPGIDAVEPFAGVESPDFVAPAPALRVGNLPNAPVLGGTRRELPLVGGHGLPAGRYVLTAIGMVGETEFRHAVDFVVPVAGAATAAGRQAPAR